MQSDRKKKLRPNSGILKPKIKIIYHANNTIKTTKSGRGKILNTRLIKLIQQVKFPFIVFPVFD